MLVAAAASRGAAARGQALAFRGYHDSIVEHYENPRNVGTLDKNDHNVGTVRRALKAIIMCVHSGENEFRLRPLKKGRTAVFCMPKRRFSPNTIQTSEHDTL